MYLYTVCLGPLDKKAVRYKNISHLMSRLGALIPSPTTPAHTSIMSVDSMRPGRAMTPCRAGWGRPLMFALP